jgi:hypothetical protein
MSRFNDYYYLTEGGNVTLRKDAKMGGNVEGAEKIPVVDFNPNQFEQLKTEIRNCLISLNKAFKEATGEDLWPNLNRNIDDGKLFSGSSRHLFTKKLNDLKQYKKTVGDIDLQYPAEKRQALKDFLDTHEDDSFGDLTYFGMGGRSPIQYNTIFKTKSFPDNISNIQVDFEPTYWEDGTPTEFSTYSHYSDWNDLKSGIKGAFSKLLTRALVSEKQRLGDITVMTPTGKVSKAAKYDNPGMRGFSVDKGVRVKFAPVTDDRGIQQQSEDGKPMYREIPTKESTYERDLSDIFAFLFEKKPDDNEKEMMHSFIGILQLAKKYLDDETEKAVFDTFMKIIWGEQAQEIEQGEFKDGINWNDFNVKKAAYDEFVKIFPELKLSDDELMDYVRPFYDKLQKRKMGNE